jgi:hypothetical protein
MQSARYSCQILTTFGVPRRIVIKVHNIRFHESPSSGSHADRCGQTDRQTTLTKPIIPLKTKRICFIYGLSAYRAVNTLHFGYKNQYLNVL